MRFSTTAMMALPLLAAAAEPQNPLDMVMEKAQYYISKLQNILPLPNPIHEAEAAAAKAGGKNVNILTLGNWKSTLAEPVKPTSKSPEEWWVLVTGGNKTCYGLCDKINSAFNESALLFKADPTAPHMGYLNCDLQPILCNSWASGPPALWIFEMGPKLDEVPIHIKRLNYTTTSVKTFTDLKSSKSWQGLPIYDGYFHPYNSPLAKFGVAVPLGYALWFFAIIPSWAFMIGISFLSRTIMARRTPPPGPGPRAAAPAN